MLLIIIGCFGARLASNETSNEGRMKRLFKAVLYFMLALALFFGMGFMVTHPEAAQWIVVAIALIILCAICWGMAGEYEPDEGGYDPRD